MTVHHIRRATQSEVDDLRAKHDAYDADMLAYYGAQPIGFDGTYYYFLVNSKDDDALPGDFFTDSYLTLKADHPAVSDYVFECEYSDGVDEDGIPVRPRVKRALLPDGTEASRDWIKPKLFSGMRE